MRCLLIYHLILAWIRNSEQCIDCNVKAKQRRHTQQKELEIVSLQGLTIFNSTEWDILCSRPKTHRCWLDLLIVKENVPHSLKNNNRKKETKEAFHRIANCSGDMRTGSWRIQFLLCLEQELPHHWRWWTKCTRTL